MNVNHIVRKHASSLDCVASQDSDQSIHHCSLISIDKEVLYGFDTSSFKQAVNILTRQLICTGWSKSSLATQVQFWITLHCGSYYFTISRENMTWNSISSWDNEIPEFCFHREFKENDKFKRHITGLSGLPHLLQMLV